MFWEEIGAIETRIEYEEESEEEREGSVGRGYMKLPHNFVLIFAHLVKPSQSAI